MQVAERASSHDQAQMNSTPGSVRQARARVIPSHKATGTRAAPARPHTARDQQTTDMIVSACPTENEL